MKTTVLLEIRIFSFWHVGSGMGRGPDVDALVLKDAAGLPFLPGRTVKGLLREGVQLCEDVGVLSSGRTCELFGTPSESGDPAGSRPGCLRFNDARLPEKERLWLRSPERSDFRGALYTYFASTSLDAEGLAKDQTLRTIEMTGPLTLQTAIDGPEDRRWSNDLSRACPLVRALGSHRNRGLGRCQWLIGQGGIPHA